MKLGRIETLAQSGTAIVVTMKISEETGVSNRAVSTCFIFSFDEAGECVLMGFGARMSRAFLLCLMRGQVWRCLPSGLKTGVTRMS